VTEDALSAALDYTLNVGGSDDGTILRIGGAYRTTQRDAESFSYNLRALGLGPQQRIGTPEELFYGAYTEGSAANITIEPNSAGGTYNATDRVSAGYAMAEIPVLSWLRLISGARVEHWDLEMDVEPVSRSLITIARNNTDVLPSIALNATLGENQTLRLSASQTLARPEYRELAPVSYRDMLGDREVFGDSSLVRTLVRNYDLRWEIYPGFEEAISVAGFVKTFDNPIEPIDVATSGASQLSFINAEGATNYGVEVEVRQGLGVFAPILNPVGFFANATFMKSEIDTGNSTLSALTNSERPMVGQAPYVVNAGLSYTSSSGSTSATVLYNVVGKRIASAAVTPIRVDTYEQARHGLDLALRFPLYGGAEAKFDAENLLNSPYEELQGDVVRYRYTTGRSFSLGVSWKL
jgi:TonB-dependent receptor